MPSLIIDLKYQPKRLCKKLLTVFCLLIMSSLGFAEDGIQPSNKDNIKILQQENLIKSQQLNNERKMRVQAQKELEELKKTNEEQGTQTIDNQGNASNSSQGTNTGQGLPNQQSSEAEQYQLSGKNKQSSSQEIESSNNTVPTTTDLGDELSTNNDSRFSVSNNMSNLPATINETTTPIADNLSMQEAGTDSNVNNPNAMADNSNLLAQLEETTNELMGAKNLLKSMEENFQQEREQFREALDQNTLKYQQDTDQLKEQLSTEKKRADQATNDKNLAEQKTKESDEKLTVAENTYRSRISLLDV